MSTIVVCDEGSSERDDLLSCVARQPGVTRVRAVRSGLDLLACLPVARPRVVMIRSLLGGVSAVDTVRQLQIRHPDTRVLILTDANSDVNSKDLHVVACMVGGRSHGYLRRDASPEEIAFAVSETLAAPARSHSQPPTEPQMESKPLTERELEVLVGMSRGQTNADIGRDLFLAAETIKTHARKVFRALDCETRAGAVAIGFAPVSSTDEVAGVSKPSREVDRLGQDALEHSPTTLQLEHHGVRDSREGGQLARQLRLPTVVMSLFSTSGRSVG